MKALLLRLYGDYLMPSRLPQYAALLRQAEAAGYRQLPVRDYLRALDGGEAGRRYLVHRHDIDSDLRTTRKLFALEQRHGVRASYYFRLCTLDYGLMRAIEDYGGEASYHYEEIATCAKRWGLREAGAVRARLPEMRAEFEANFHRIEQALGRKLHTVASHGDFANRRLGVANHELLADPALRRRCGIACECYDARLLDSLDGYISDRPPPRWFHPQPPQAALGRLQRICLLTHPVQWHTNWLDRSRHNLLRLAEEWRW
ncbi:hypothetical protein ACLB1G_05465 [Oxalobacteraceae bacterium A2-2]